MPMTVAQHIVELTRRFPLCGQGEAEELFFYSFQKLCREHPWPFCIAEDRVVTEEEYSDGTVAVTENGTGVVGTGTTWLTSWTTAPSTRRIIIEGRPESYRVSAVTSGTGLTLRDAWVGETDSELTYRMYRDVYPLPTNCGYGGEYLLIDAENQRMLRLKDYGTLADRGVKNYGVTSSSTWAARVDLTSAATGGRPQVQFDPPPSSLQVFPLIYFRSATKPVSVDVYPDPLFASDAEDLIWKRMLLEYAKDPRHKRPDWRDFQNDYDDALMDAKRKFDGGAQLDAVIKTNYPSYGYDSFGLVLGDADLTPQFS